MINEGIVDSREYKKERYCKTLCQIKIFNGKPYIDVRKWFKNDRELDFKPMKAGLMLEIEDWKIILPLIQELIFAVDGKT